MSRGPEIVNSTRLAVAVGCVLVSAAAGCSPRTPSTPASRSKVASLSTSAIPGIGATRANWDDSHTPNPANNDGLEYGDDPSLPSYVAPSGAVYGGVNDQGTGRIQFYDLSMHAVAGEEALRRVRQELPSDATVAWDLTFDQCFRVAFNSATLQAAGHYMADVQLEYIQEDGSRRTSPDTFNHAWLWLDTAGSRPNPEVDCSSWTS
jgi:hypothetical protein